MTDGHIDGPALYAELGALRSDWKNMRDDIADIKRDVSQRRIKWGELIGAFCAVILAVIGITAAIGTLAIGPLKEAITSIQIDMKANTAMIEGQIRLAEEREQAYALGRVNELAGKINRNR
jgi:hypothetical protein